MKPIVVLVCSALVSAVIALGITALRSSASSPQDTAFAARGNDEAAWTRSISELRSEQSQLKKSIEDLRAEMAHRPAVEARVPLGEIEAAVQHALEQKTNAPSSSAVAAVAKAAPKKSFDSQGILLALTSKDSTSEQRQALWKEVSEAGELDTMVALFEQRAKDDPQSSGAQLDLGRAYLQKIFKVGSGPEAGVWGTKADKAFNAALAIDDHNWDARFAKAVSLSFWPPMLGKQNEAIKNFEVLVEQQTAQAQKPEFAQTYWALGNMYSQSGDKQKALATWQQGLTLFPGNAQLEAQIANAQGH